MVMTATVTGWYPDPSGRHERRWWDGRSWTPRVLDGDRDAIDLDTSTADGFDDIRAYVEGAFTRGLLDPATHDRLLADVEEFAHPWLAVQPELVTVGPAVAAGRSATLDGGLPPLGGVATRPPPPTALPPPPPPPPPLPPPPPAMPDAP